MSCGGHMGGMSVVYDVDCAELGGRWSATLRGTGLPATTGHADPAALVFATVDLMAARTGMRPSRLRLHPAPGASFGGWFPSGRSDHRTRTVADRDWSDTWTATPAPDLPGVVLVSTSTTEVPVRPVPAPRSPELQPGRPTSTTTHRTT